MSSSTDGDDGWDCPVCGEGYSEGYPVNKPAWISEPRIVGPGETFSAEYVATPLDKTRTYQWLLIVVGDEA